MSCPRTHRLRDLIARSVVFCSSTNDTFSVEVSDNGCGMEDIDACVAAFRSNKVGATAAAAAARDGAGGADHASTCAPGRAASLPAGGLQAAKAREADAKNAACAARRRPAVAGRAPGDAGPAAPDDDDGGGGGERCTSGRYGVGLTLCLLHAQRL